jgi:beta-phosphoglucomutase-like phosphatase (HAD superfamily)
MILDMDGVLVDSEPIHGEAFKLFLEKLKVPYTEQFINDLVGHSVNHNIRTINETYLQERPLNVEEGVKIRDAIYLDLITSRPLRPLKGIEDLILICQQKSIKLGLATSSVHEQVDAILNSLSRNNNQGINFINTFEAVVGGDQVLKKKPAPDIYSKVIASLKVPNTECIAIEDSGAGIISAKANNIFCIALRNKYLKENDAQGADLIVNSIEEVTDMIKIDSR